jgi:hypothetical protein
MSTNNLEGLRSHLFTAMEQLADETKKVDLERIKAMQGVAQTIINSAMVEVKHSQVTGRKTSNFLEQEKLPPGITGVTQHRLK